MINKRIILILTMLLLLVPMFALEVTIDWSWEQQDEDVKYFRYQVDSEEGEWSVVRNSVNNYSLTGVDGTIVHTLYIQQSYDGLNWSKSIASQSQVVEPIITEVLDPIIIEAAKEPLAISEVVVTITDAEVEEVAVEDSVVEEKLIKEVTVAEAMEEKIILEEKESEFSFVLGLNAGVSTRSFAFKPMEVAFDEMHLNLSLSLGFENIAGPWGIKINTGGMFSIYPDDIDVLMSNLTLKEFIKYGDYFVDVLPLYFSGDAGIVTFYGGLGAQLTVLNDLRDPSTSLLEISAGLQTLYLGVVGEAGIRFNCTDLFGLSIGIDTVYLGMNDVYSTAKASLNFSF